MSPFLRKFRDAVDRLGVRIAAIAILSLIAIGVARLLRTVLPEQITSTVGARSVRDLLQIIATSMLAVVTFSLSVMVSVYRSAAGQWTPRVHRLMLDDRTTQNTLATFIGAYIFSLTSIVLLQTSLFPGEEQVILFFFTILILILIIVAMINWVIHLQTLGSLIDAARRIEKRTSETFEERMNNPCLGGTPMEDVSEIPDDAVEIEADETGYVQEIFQRAIHLDADDNDVDVYLHHPVGRFVHRGEALCYLSEESDEMIESVRRNIRIGDLRTFEQDPRFGLIVLGEIGSKALSAGINDPGTAVDIIGRMSRILDSYRSEMDAVRDEEPAHPRLHIPILAASDLIEDSFGPIARDGVSVVEVQVTLQKALAAIMHHPDETLASAAAEAAEIAYGRAENSITNDFDLKRVREAMTSTDDPQRR